MNMDTQAELKYLIEDLINEDVQSIFAVRISGDKQIVTVTCIPSDGYSEKDRDIISGALWNISEIIKRNNPVV
jgi:hypothetical protein